LAVRQNTAHAVVPVHTKGEFELFRQLIGSQGFYYSLSKQPVVANASKAIDFIRLAQAWTAKVHELVLESGSHEAKLFYKLPEQLERHYKTWLQARGERATLVNTTQMRLSATALLTNPSRQAIVLPPVPLLVPRIQIAPSTQIHQGNKGKGKERIEPVNGMWSFSIVVPYCINSLWFAENPHVSSSNPLIHLLCRVNRHLQSQDPLNS
jgi:hypothetical protein